MKQDLRCSHRVAVVVVMTLVMAASASAQVSLTQITTPFNNPIGIDHHPPTNSVVVSVFFPTGSPHNFELIAEDGTHAQFSTLTNLTNEVKVATAKDENCGFSLAGFPAGTVFAGSGTPGHLVRIPPDGVGALNPWVVLPGETGLLRGSQYVDSTGLWGGDVIVVTTEGGVWRINALGVPTLVASIADTHLEGVITLPFDPARYGPFAGTIVAGAEDDDGFFTIDLGGTVTFHQIGTPGSFIQPEDLDIVRPGENFFGVDFSSGIIWGANASEFAGMEGDLIVAQEFPGILWRVTWNPVTNQFDRQNLVQVAQWEHVTFSTAGITPLDCTLAGGPYSTECTGMPVRVPVAGAETIPTNCQDRTFEWTTDCPNGMFDDPTMLETVLSLDGPPPCPLECNVTLTITLADGNQLSCTTTVTVTDTVAPELSCIPPDTTVECDEIPPPPIVEAHDDCAGDLPVMFDAQVMPGACPNSFQIVRTWSAEDDCGNQVSDSQTITVVDTTAPVLSCVPDDVTVECDDIPDPPDVTAVDNCDGVLPVLLDTQVMPGPCPQSFTIVRTWTATDTCDNTTSDSQTISVVDTTPPVLVDVPCDATVECNAVPAPPVVTATDNCDPNVTVILATQTLPGNCPNESVIIRTWSAMDACGNPVSESQTLTVVDTNPPVLMGVPADAELDCEDPVPPPPVVTAVDACQGPVPVMFNERNLGSGCSGDILLREWTAVDACGNAACREIQVVTVNDTTAPMLMAALEPLGPTSPMSPTSVGSPCSAPNSRQFRVTCSAIDNCDPEPDLEARFVVVNHAVVDGECVQEVEEIDCDCGDVVEIRLVAPPCPSEPREARQARSCNADCSKIVTGEEVTLEVTATDRCGNTATATVDPTTPPDPPCPEGEDPDGNCCPPISPPEPDCDDPCGS